MFVRRCPTLPHASACSTIGAVRLSFRVRNVAGRFPDAVTTETLPPSFPAPRVCGGGCWVGWFLCVCALFTYPCTGSQQPVVGLGLVLVWGCCFRYCTVDAKWCGQVLGLLVPVNSDRCRSSISGLSTRSSSGSLNPTRGVGVLILKRASRLDAFSGYPFRT
jgi:hypothetical protein